MAQPWALMQERMGPYAAVLARWARGETASDAVLESVRADAAARDARRAQNSARAGGRIQVLNLFGVITQRGNMADDLSGPGSTSAQAFAAALRAALADDWIDGVLIDIDSPGGSVYGCPELAAEIAASRGGKPIVAFADSLAASAAYWIGSQADEFYMTPSGEVGSIGVYLMHQDISEAMKADGIATTLVSAGKFKTEGSPYAPLDAAALAHLQSRVDDYYSAFTKAVASGRGVTQKAVREGMGQGRVLGADDALAEKMVDGVMTFDGVVSRMGTLMKRSRGPSALASAQRTLQILG